MVYVGRFGQKLMRTQRALIVSSLLIAVALAGCADSGDNQQIDDVVGGAGTGGGSVNNIPPTFSGFTPSTTTVDNSGSSVIVFSGTLSDPNSELDLEGSVLTVALGGVYTGTFERTITNLEAAGADTEPTAYTDGWKVWSGDALDGVMNFKFRFTVPIATDAGTLTFTPTVDPAGTGTGLEPVTGSTTNVAVTVFSELVIDGPFLLDGTDDSGNRWGRWAADPGATNVASENYIKITNTGQDATASVVIDFTESVFTGISNPNFTIDVTNNVQFAWFEDTTPGTTAPSEGTFSYLPANADGSVTTTFSGKGNVIWVHYRVVELPSPLPAQTYGVAYTATEL